MNERNHIRPTKHILTCHKDRLHLDRQGPPPVAGDGHPDTYRDMVVVKPWGHEFLIFENELVAVWLLRIRKDHATSLHCHPRKKTTLSLLSGRALSTTMRHRNFLAAGDSLVIDAGVFHATKALSLDGVLVIEVETPPDKHDLVRLEDAYGRESAGYEGTSQIVTRDLDRYGYFYLAPDATGTAPVTNYGHFSLVLEEYADQASFDHALDLNPGSAFCLFRGEIRSIDGSVIATVGETVRATFLAQQDNPRINTPLLAMRFTTFG